MGCTEPPLWRLCFSTNFPAGQRSVICRLAIPARLAEMGVEAAWLPDLAEQAVADHCNATNPRRPGVEDYVALFREAMG